MESDNDNVEDMERFDQYYNYVHGAFIGGLARKGKRETKKERAESDSDDSIDEKIESASTLEPAVREAFKDLQESIKWKPKAVKDGSARSKTHATRSTRREMNTDAMNDFQMSHEEAVAAAMIAAESTSETNADADETGETNANANEANADANADVNAEVDDFGVPLNAIGDAADFGAQ